MIESLHSAIEQIDTLTSMAVQKIKTTNIPGFKDMTTADLQRFVSNAYRAEFNYLEQFDTEAWKQFCQTIVAEYARQGIKYFSVVQVFETMIEVLNEFLKDGLANCEEIDGQPTTKTLEKIERRLQGLKMLTVSSVIAAGVKDIRTV